MSCNFARGQVLKLSGSNRAQKLAPTQLICFTVSQPRQFAKPLFRSNFTKDPERKQQLAELANVTKQLRLAVEMHTEESHTHDASRVRVLGVLAAVHSSTLLVVSIDEITLVPRRPFMKRILTNDTDCRRQALSTDATDDRDIVEYDARAVSRSCNFGL